MDTFDSCTAVDFHLFAFVGIAFSRSKKEAYEAVAPPWSAVLPYQLSNASSAVTRGEAEDVCLQRD